MDKPLRPAVELGDGDTLRDALEEAFPDVQRCHYLNCGQEVSAYEITATCRYCKHVYCRDHADYHVHGCCLRL